jgi:hypothetical protein
MQQHHRTVIANKTKEDILFDSGSLLLERSCTSLMVAVARQTLSHRHPYRYLRSMRAPLSDSMKLSNTTSATVIFSHICHLVNSDRGYVACRCAEPRVWSAKRDDRIIHTSHSRFCREETAAEQENELLDRHHIVPLY